MLARLGGDGAQGPCLHRRIEHLPNWHGMVGASRGTQPDFAQANPPPEPLA
jgi:hypothetical protein